MHQKRIDFTLDLVKKAGENIRTLMSQDIEIETKSSDSDFVTNVDKQTEIFLVKKIQNEYENQDFLTEENTTPRQDSKQLWIIDPIDGTTNFIFQRKNFAISIAYYEDKKPVFGIVYDVMHDDLYLGITGKGATLNGKKLEVKDPTLNLKNSIVCADYSVLSLFPHGANHFMESVLSQRYLGSAAIEICMVAKGDAHAYVSKSLKVWDVAAGVIILKEAGGTFFFGGHDDAIYLHDKGGVFISAQTQTIKNELENMMDFACLQEIL